MITLVSVLHIEDDESDQQALSGLVRDHDLPWNITPATTVAEARKLLRDRRFDIVVADSRLPDGECAELFDEVETPFILLTANPGEHLALRTLERGADDYLPKDVEQRYLTALPSAVDRTLHRQRLYESARRLTSRLVESEERARLLVDGVRDHAIFMLDPQGRVSTWNKAAERIKGYRSEEILGQSFSVCYPPEDVAAGKPQRALALALEHGVFTEECWLLRKDGTPFWAGVSISALRNDAGELRGFADVSRDLTERKRAEQQLALLTEEAERRRRLYRTILSSTPDLVFIFDLHKRCSYANEALLTAWEKLPEDVVGRTLAEIGYPAEIAEMREAEMEQVIATRQALCHEVPLSTGSGGRTYECIFVPVLGACGEVEAVAGTARDVTDRKFMEDELRQSAAALATADRRKDEFLATLAHELRNPLAPIRNAVELLRLQGKDPQALHKITDIVDRQLQHLTRLVDDLLEVSRISRGKIRLQKAPVALDVVLRSAVEATRPLIDAAGHELTFLLPSEPIWLHADATRLEQVFGNLLNNAAKFTPSGGHIWLIAERRDRHAIVMVRDTGIGIPEEHLLEIFKMFSQVTPALDRTSSGLGIGLALVQSLVELHGGVIEAHSAGLGRGSEFVVRLPLASAPAPSPQDGDREASTLTSLRSWKILVVDDNRDAANTLARLLSIAGHHVRTAYDGLEALESCARFGPEVVLLDIGLPKMNGYEVARRIREQPWSGSMTLIAQTGWGQDDDRRRALEAGCDYHLTKPIDLATIVHLLDHIAGTRQ